MVVASDSALALHFRLAGCTKCSMSISVIDRNLSTCREMLLSFADLDFLGISVILLLVIVFS